jgi:outer membrane protein OmpA-like peptidoglycan-associated protein
VSQGVQMNNISAAGYGKNKPIADNGTTAGRAQNRRVQLVVSGDAIGVHQSGPDAQ